MLALRGPVRRQRARLATSTGRRWLRPTTASGVPVVHELARAQQRRASAWTHDLLDRRLNREYPGGQARLLRW